VCKLQRNKGDRRREIGRLPTEKERTKERDFDSISGLRFLSYE